MPRSLPLSLYLPGGGEKVTTPRYHHGVVRQDVVDSRDVMIATRGASRVTSLERGIKDLPPTTAFEELPAGVAWTCLPPPAPLTTPVELSVPK